MFKLFIWLKKRMQLAELQAEHRFFLSFFGEELNGDEQVMREELVKLKTKKKQSEDDLARAMDLEKEINKLVQIRGRIKNSEQIENELKAFISTLW